MTEEGLAARRLVTVVGNRPQFVKAAAVSTHLRGLVDETLVHSGQHYDRELSEVFFEELRLPPPAHLLAVGSGSHAEQTAAIMAGLEPLLAEGRADAVLVYGDTNTTLAAALVAAKLGLPLAHVEAGMRSFDMSMPEEVNRVAVDRLADLLLCPTATAVRNLEAEGLGSRAILVGDTMADIAIELGPVAERRSGVLEHLGLSRAGYLVATVHRAGNVDDPAALAAAVEILHSAAGRHGPLVFPAHPRTRARLIEAGAWEELGRAPGVIVTDPLGYLDFAALLRGGRALITDSGGLQKEAHLAGVPCVTLRLSSEWPETIEAGANVLVGLDPGRASAALEEQLAAPEPGPPDLSVYGGGKAGERCAAELAALLAGASSAS